MNKYLNDDCISIINKYTRELTVKELTKIIFVEMMNEITYSIDKKEKYSIITYELYENKLDIIMDNDNNLNNSDDFFIHLLTNWVYVYTKTYDNNNTENKIYKIIHDMTKNNKDFRTILNTIIIYKYIEDIFNNYYGFSTNEKENILSNIY